jgi:hypothetical protein
MQTSQMLALNQHPWRLRLALLNKLAACPRLSHGDKQLTKRLLQNHSLRERQKRVRQRADYFQWQAQRLDKQIANAAPDTGRQ